MAQPPTDDDEERLRRRTISWKQFLWGLELGTLASAPAWIPGWNKFEWNTAGNSIFLLPLLKFLLATAGILTRYRGFGIGLLLSIPFGAAIYFASCVVHYNAR